MGYLEWQVAVRVCNWVSARVLCYGPIVHSQMHCAQRSYWLLLARRCKLSRLGHGKSPLTCFLVVPEWLGRFSATERDRQVQQPERPDWLR
jgi:hypothetical protein